jgi:formylglycine-generating enzyme required for sulfatase activity
VINYVEGNWVSASMAATDKKGMANMRNFKTWVWMVVWPLLAHLVVLAPAIAQERRVALVMGNSQYPAAPLRNPPQDVKLIADALKAVGFKVQVEQELDQKQMKRAIRDFGTQAQGADVAFLYYSGHGTQVTGENYLIPLKATIEKEGDYELEAVSANALLRQIASAKPKAAIVVFDACRDNPFAVSKGSGKGLGRMDAPTGTMIAFATAPNTTANDEGHYAKVLAAQIKTPGLELVDVFRNTTAEVRRLTGGRQEPRVSELSITDRVFLAGSISQQPLISNELHAGQALPLQTGKVIKDCDICPEMVVIPAETEFSGAGSGNRLAPQGGVKRFLLGKLEITQGQWQALMGDNPSHFTACGAGCPVEMVNWLDAQAYVRKLSERTGQQYRLPTYVEWEYVARVGAGEHPTSPGLRIDHSMSANSKSTERTYESGSRQANALGVYDMYGNVAEWVENGPKKLVGGVSLGNRDQRILLGGFGNSALDFHDTIVHKVAFDFYSLFVGFRVARSLP